MPKKRPDAEKLVPVDAAQIKRVQPKDGTTFTYANHIEVGNTALDVRILFGEILGVSRENNQTMLTIQERVQVTIGWIQAKLLSRLLTELVSRYEQSNGPIKLDIKAIRTDDVDPLIGTQRVGIDAGVGL